MGNFKDTYLSGANIDFIEGLYARFLEDPASIDPSWRDIFQSQGPDGRPIFQIAASGNGAARVARAPAVAPVIPQRPAGASVARGAGPIELEPGESLQDMGLQAKVDHTVYAYRLRGHLVAQLDPLGRQRAVLPHVADLALVKSDPFSQAEFDEYVDSQEVFAEKRVTVRQLLERLRRTYTSKIGVEFMTLLDSTRRRWLMKRMEHTENDVDPGAEEQRKILTKLAYAEGFESFLHTKYVGAKRFSLDGGESLIPMLHAFLEKGGELGMRELLIGMAHRGRLNVLTNILGKSPAQIFSEFQGPKDPRSFLSRGDVKYHQGFSSDYVTRDGTTIHLSLAFNPSHLEAVDPVVEGRTRAKQDRGHAAADSTAVVPLLIHGDAAFMGQGVVAETLNLSGLKGYTTGGTVHIVINNQVGFTTDPHDSRSSIYSTAIAQMLDVPIFHVNGDDPEACVHVMKLATEYRQKFKSDVVIDLVCFRRYGHNEMDTPDFTQPQMYQLVHKHPTVATIYAQELVKAGRLTQQDVDAIRAKTAQDFSEAHARIQKESAFKEPSALEGLWKKYVGGSDADVPDVDTGVEKKRLTSLLEKLATVPEGFTPNPILARSLLPGRKLMAEGQRDLDWSAGESLAYATLLTEGYPVRLTGQDSERGTFTHRHAVIHDVKTGEEFTPLQNLGPDQAAFRLFNSPLSELACVGFEYGYSLDYPDALVVWEAQFGDFVNGAQIILDQFVVAGERKWRRLSGLTLLLPHGYEGQGPEHSSARLERFLQNCAEDNIQVCYPTNPAQIFHLLRRQALRPIRKPLVVMSPKSLLRNPEAVSKLEDLTEGTFQRVIPDRKDVDPKGVQRLLLCSGKIYYDLVKERDARKDNSVAIVRVEQLYPFPRTELMKLMKKMSKLSEVFWVQEEPRNMGAWSFVFPLLNELVQSLAKTLTVGYVGRVDSASPATGFESAHKIEQAQIVEQAVTRGTTKNGR